MKLHWNRHTGQRVLAEAIEAEAERMVQADQPLRIVEGRLLVRIGPELYDCEILRWCRPDLTPPAKMVGSDERPNGRSRREEGDREQ